MLRAGMAARNVGVGMAARRLEVSGSGGILGRDFLVVRSGG